MDYFTAGNTDKSEKRYAGDSGQQAFMEMLDETFARLRKQKAEYSITRLAELDIVLAGVERELDDIIAANRCGV
jgi:hypothetical protein